MRALALLLLAFAACGTPAAPAPAPAVAPEARTAPAPIALPPPVAPDGGVVELLALVPERVIDAIGDAPRTGVAVLVRGERIVSVVAIAEIPAEARRIELPGHTLTPGFIDCHTHLTSALEGDWTNAPVRLSAARRALRGTVAARQILHAGFTTVRDVGSDGFADVDLRDAIAAGQVEGPRMFVAAHSLGITGGHCDTGGFLPEVGEAWERPQKGVADGVDEVRKAARYQLKYGADHIKLCATGGVLSEGDAVGVRQYTEEEMRAAVEVAAFADKKVAAHAHGTEGIKLAIRAGVASIEHGSMLDDEAIRMMIERGTVYVPTLLAGTAVEERARAGGFPAWAATKALAIAPRMRASFALAARSRIKIALGTDVGVMSHARAAEEFVLMIGLGLPALRALRAGTIEAARLIGIDAETGSIEPGKLADLVAMPGDPLTDATAFLKVDFVMKAGVVVKRPAAPAR